MTRKDYVLIAAAIRRVSDAPMADLKTTRAIVQSIASALEDDNERFNASSFKFDCTGTVDLSGADYVSRVGAE